MISDSIYISDLKEIEDAIPNASNIYGMSILVTGGSGLIGSAIVDYLSNYSDNVNVFVACRNPDGVKERFGKNNVKIVRYDAVEEIGFNQHFDYIIHGASFASPNLYVDKPVETMLTNLYGTINIAEYAIKHQAKRLVYISSSEVYGKREDVLEYDELDYGYVDISSPRSCYPSSKRSAETLLASYKSEYGLDYVVVRPGHIYGPTANSKDNRVSSAFFWDVIRGNDIVLKSSGSQRRSYCYVMDCVSAVLTAMLNGENGASYNVSNDSSVCSIRELAECIAEVSGKKVIFQNPNDKESGAFNPMNNSVLSAKKLLALGWVPKFDLEKGVTHTYESLKARINHAG